MQNLEALSPDFEPNARKKLSKLNRAIRLMLVPLLLLAFTKASQADSVHLNQHVDVPTLSPIPPEKEIPATIKTPAQLLNEYFAIGDKLDVSVNTVWVQELNDLDISPENYDAIVNSWPADVPIFLYLDSYDAKVRFIQHVLAQDDLDSYEYQAPDLGPDVDGDEVVELRSRDGQTFDEAGNLLNETAFICSDFSQELSKRYGLYPGIPTKPVKFRLPLFKALSGEGYVSDGDKKAYGRGHTTNAILIGSPSKVDDVSRWYFIEPQTDQQINPFGVDYRLVKLAIHGPGFPEEVLLSFFLKANGRPEMITSEESQILFQLERWMRFNILQPVTEDDSMRDELDLSQFSTADMYHVSSLAVDAGHLTAEKIIAAVKDAKSLPAGFDQADFASTLGK